MASESGAERKGLLARFNMTAADGRHAKVAAAFVVAGYAGLVALAQVDHGTAGSFASEVMLRVPGWREASMHVMFALLTGTVGAAAGAVYDRYAKPKEEKPATPKP